MTLLSLETFFICLKQQTDKKSNLRRIISKAKHVTIFINWEKKIWWDNFHCQRHNHVNVGSEQVEIPSKNDIKDEESHDNIIPLLPSIMEPFKGCCGGDADIVVMICIFGVMECLSIKPQN